MRDGTGRRTLLIRVVVTVVSWLGSGSALFAQDLTTPSRVVDEYLVGLANGDMETLNAIVDGAMEQKNRHIFLSPDTYAQSLRDHYAGVDMTVEGMSPAADEVRARVRFDYPGEQSSVIEFILTRIDGQWKITDEIF